MYIESFFSILSTADRIFCRSAFDYVTNRNAIAGVVIDLSVTLSNRVPPTSATSAAIRQVAPLSSYHARE